MLTARRFVLRSDPDWRDEDAAVEFRLTYHGRVPGQGSKNKVEHKHTLRRSFHRQLRRYWQIHPYLKEAVLSERRTGFVYPPQRLIDYLAQNNERCGYNFVPLVTHELSLICSLDVLFLRPSLPGEKLSSGDIDNRIRVILDALRMPTDRQELAGFEQPDDDEKPFFCLLADDKLVSHLSVETDTLLEALNDVSKYDENDVRLVISVRLKPFDVGWDNISFG